MQKYKVCWLSAGISSFVAGYLEKDVDEWIYIDIADQHPDSLRFIHDAEKIIGTGKNPVLLYAVETCIQLTLTEMNEHLRPLFVREKRKKYVYRLPSSSGLKG